jgi:hypothetical protein
LTELLFKRGLVFEQGLHSVAPVSAHELDHESRLSRSGAIDEQAADGSGKLKVMHMIRKGQMKDDGVKRGVAGQCM